MQRIFLVIGAGDGGVVKELTRYDRVERIDLVEMDGEVIEACRAYLPENACRLDDSRVHIYFDNALRFIRRCSNEYDLIIVDSNDPFGPSEGYFTREFYGICYNALREDGIMVNQQGSPFYKHDAEAHAKKPQTDCEYIPNQPRLSGTYSDICRRLLAVWLCQQKNTTRLTTLKPVSGRHCI